MRIAIFDKNVYNSNNLKHSIYVYSNNKGIESVIECFSNVTNFLKLQNRFNLFFISYDTDEGINAAIKLYQVNPKVPIIITAGDYHQAIKAFKINAYSFLKLPINEQMLFEILDDLVNTNFFGPLLLCNGCENICINTNEIVYIEANNKHCIIHLENNSVDCKKTMARVVNVLPENLFLKISRSYVVNSDYVTRFNSKNIILNNGTILYPSRHFYKDFKHNYYKIRSPVTP